jgi:hypothetical protein
MLEAVDEMTRLWLDPFPPGQPPQRNFKAFMTNMFRNLTVSLLADDPMKFIRFMGLWFKNTIDNDLSIPEEVDSGWWDCLRAFGFSSE